MLKHFLFILLFSFGINAFAQELDFKAPDYKQIEKEIQDKKSAFYYPKLIDRLAKNDTLMTQDDFRYLYFGYVFQPKYNAFWRSPDEIKLREYYNKEKLETADYNEIIKLANHTLTDFPFDLKQLNYLAYIYHLKGDDEAAKITSYKFHNIMNAILSSGDGKKCETGFHVLLVEHEYVMLNLFELESKGQSLVGNCDYLSFEKGKYNVDGVYFNIEKMLENEAKGIK
ncbi:protein of unknown function [Flavobacterium resistens]|uniref:DUF4919 domain-containing protein n=1 Tax=Flavobacterium resistens TaxID=443612 RepID=A0A521DG79_9FLAO|nr:DUF4919 domain-containing protein [Flavobacterium resistens]MRX68687.1 DUF4919 domain-containing protein [Flavobacterium resistens]SMO70626.1 protein of unknown function [Flavobacterium resistens]